MDLHIGNLEGFTYRDFIGIITSHYKDPFEPSSYNRMS